MWIEELGEEKKWEWRVETTLSLTVKSEGRLLVEEDVGLMKFLLFLEKSFCIFKGETLEIFTCLRRGFTLVGKVDSTGEKVFEKLRDGSR